MFCLCISTKSLLVSVSNCDYLLLSAIIYILGTFFIEFAFNKYTSQLFARKNYRSCIKFMFMI